MKVPSSNNYTTAPKRFLHDLIISFALFYLLNYAQQLFYGKQSCIELINNENYIKYMFSRT